MQITNGTVEYGRTVKPADFESKVAKVSLNFAVAETETNPDAVIAKVFDMAMGEVHRRLGLNGPAYTQRMVETPTAQVEKPAAQVVKLSAAEVNGLSGKGAAAAPQSNPTVAPPKTAPNGATNADPLNMAPSSPVTPASSTGASPTAASSVAPAPAPVADPLAIVPTATAPVDTSKPVTITDNDLHAAVHQAVERKVSPAQVRELTAEFTGVVGRSMTTIDQEKRAEFIARVKELKPNA